MERVSPFRGMIIPWMQICPYPVNVFVLLHGTWLLCTNMAHKLRTGSYLCPSPRDSPTLYAPSARTLPLRRFHPFDYYVQANYPSTILGIQYDNSSYYSRNSADTFDDSDCADALKQICRFPLTILWIAFDASAEILWKFRRKSMRIPQMICVKLTRRICRYCKVSCDMYRMWPSMKTHTLSNNFLGKLVGNTYVLWYIVLKTFNNFVCH